MQKTAAMLALTFMTVMLGYASANSAFAPRPTTIQDSIDQTAQSINDVAIVEVDDLPLPLQKQAEAQFAETSGEELQKFRDAIDRTPQISALLIIAANLDSDGLLTLVVIIDT